MTTPPQKGDHWADRAACRDEDPELFFPQRYDSRQADTAKAVCARCLVSAECLTDALAPDNRHTEGIRAGLTPDEVRTLRRLNKDQPR